MKKRILTAGAAIVVVLAAAMYLWMGSSTPHGQDPLLRLTQANFTDFEAAFDNSTDGPRLVVLLSPT